MSYPTLPVVSAPSSPTLSDASGAVPLPPTADAGFEIRWAAWQARGRRQEAATRRHVLIGAPLFALVASGLYFLLGR